MAVGFEGRLLVGGEVIGMRAGRGKTAPHDLPTTGADYPYLKTVRHH